MGGTLATTHLTASGLHCTTASGNPKPGPGTIGGLQNWNGGIGPIDLLDRIGNCMEKPNFIIFLTDDQGYGDLSCMGSPDVQTPHIDGLAQGGARFTSW
tara:strand:+ start:53 stop:349 length:297 start_codon:yes stop_codon:yes gene_type:complete